MTTFRTYGEASGRDCGDGMPSELRRDRLVEIIRDPLLNHLVALAYEDDETDFSEDTSLKALYDQLLDGVYRRDYDLAPHPGTRVVGGETEESLLAVVHACRRALLSTEDESEPEAGRHAGTVFDNEEEEPLIAGDWIRRLQFPSTERARSLLTNLLSSIRWRSASLTFSVLHDADLQTADLQGAYPKRQISKASDGPKQHSAGVLIDEGTQMDDALRDHILSQNPELKDKLSGESDE